jgi:glycosyltransferase involved in cell wall biosynthesis
MITYNHEQFIVEAIEGVLAQETNFNYQLILGEDFSTDGTRAICEEYADKYPDKVKLLPSDQNLGMMPNFIRTLKKCSGTYIALCEGDDYWIDSLKLQKQVDYLENNLDCSLVGTMNNILDTNEVLKKAVFDSGHFNLSDLIEKHRCHTSTFLFRREQFDIPSWFINTNAGDTSLIWLCALKGYIKVLPDFTSVYRIHDGGVISSKNIKDTHAVILENLEFLKNYFPSHLNEIASKIKARKSYFSLWDYSLLALLKRKTPLKEWIHFYYKSIGSKCEN